MLGPPIIKEENNTVFDFLNGSSVLSIGDRAIAGENDTKRSLSYIQRVAEMKTGKQIAESLGISTIIPVVDKKTSNIDQIQGSSTITNNFSTSSIKSNVVNVSSMSRLAQLEDRERDLINQINKYNDGLKRNIDKDPVIIRANN